MNILVTGAKGFIGKNLISELKNRNYANIFQYDIDSDSTLLDSFAKECDFVFHLAGVNRPKDDKEFMEGNFGFTSNLLSALERHGNCCPVMMSSSVQAELDNPYGISKRAAEELVFSYGQKNNANVMVYRFTNVFGKWCKPNYNSVVATFCHNIARGINITINDPNTKLNLVYIDDVVGELINALEGNPSRQGKFCHASTVHTASLGKIAELIHSFKDSRVTNTVPDMSDAFTKKLYSTYLTYLPKNDFSYNLKMNVDQRGSFTEFIKTTGAGQVSVNISKPGITKGNHWHHTKNEKFLVVSGRGIIRLRKYDEDEIVSYYVSAEKLEVIDIPPGYTHNIENLGDTDLVTIMWANESFNPDLPDTYFLEV
ncbi:MAG: capsular polysaccharide biosynthesis protein CapF [Eubacteriales bacterium]|jgi:UDP-2-acetamido-2,6-beta-L-arabino-hexul-4-ose reductase|nr:capsular polysaccharide biosynthesis protein CapF [Eubacteriales bacterium]